MKLIFQNVGIKKRRERFVKSGIQKTRCPNELSIIMTRYRFNWIFDMFIIHGISRYSCKRNLSTENKIELILSDIRAVIKFTGPLNRVVDSKSKRNNSCFCDDCGYGCIAEVSPREFYGDRVGRRLANMLRLNPDEKRFGSFVGPTTVISDAIANAARENNLLTPQASYPDD